MSEDERRYQRFLHLIIHIHIPSAELLSDHSVVRRSRKIDAEIAISWGDHSHSHLIIHIHIPLAELQSDHSVVRRMGEELGNYVHQNRQTVTLLSTPTAPGRVLGHRQTDRQTVYMGEELGNYVHQN